MLYTNHPNRKNITITFENALEVRTVQQAFLAHNEYLDLIGNDSSVSEYQKTVAKWTGDTKDYKGATDRVVKEKLDYFNQTTDETVENILDNQGDPARYERAGRRYELGQCALLLLESIELHASMEEDWSEVLEDK